MRGVGIKRLLSAIISVICIFSVLTFVWYRGAVSKHFQWSIPETKEYGRVLKVAAMEDNAPYSFYDENGVPSGFDIELIYAIGDYIGADIELTMGKWTAIKSGTKQGKYDLLLGVTSAEEQSKIFELSNITIWDTYNLYEKEDSRGSKIAVMEDGYESGFHLLSRSVPFLTQKGQLLPCKTYEDCMSAVARGEARAALLASRNGAIYLQQEQYRHIKCTTDAVYTSILCIAAQKGNTALIKEINEGISYIQREGVQDVIRAHWLSDGTENLSLLEFVQQQFVSLLIALLALTAMAIAMVGFWRRKEVEQALERAKLTEQLVAEQHQFRGAVTQKSIYTVFTDITANQIIEDIIDRDGNNLLAELGYSVPAPYDEESEAYLREMQVTPLSENARRWFSHEQVIQMYHEGLTAADVMDIYVGKTDTYIRMVPLLYEDAVTGHIFCRCICNDVTAQYKEKEEADKKIRDAQVALDLVGEQLIAAKTGLWILVSEEGKHPQMIADRGMRILIGASEDATPEACYDAWRAGIREEEMPLVNRGVDNMLSNKQAEVIYPWYYQDGRQIYVRCVGSPTTDYQGTGFSIGGYHQDVTEMMTTQKQQDTIISELRSRHDNVNNILAQMNTGIWVMEKEEGKEPRLISDAVMRRLIGAGDKSTPEECFKLWMAGIHEEDLYVVTKMEQELNEKGISEISYPWFYEDGREIYVRCYGTLDKSGKVPYWRVNGYHQNVTELYQTEKDRDKYYEEMKTAYEEAKQANAAKTNFLSSMSHDIRTPMNAIIGMVDIALHHIDEPERVEDSLHKIKVSSRQLVALVNDILDISAIESGKLKLRLTENNLFTCFERFRATYIPEIQQKAQTADFRIHNIISPWALFDDVRVMQIVSNLLGNAIKYTPERGTITFEAYQEYGENRLLYTTFIVEDTGIGMSEAFMQRMWDTFSRATDTRINTIQGAGLGLAIVKELVELMDGTIEVRSELNKGSVFKVRLALQPLAKKTEEGEEAPVEDTLQLHALVAEDNEMNWEIAEELLAMHGITADCARDGAICVKMFEEAPAGTYAVILMDMQMPNMDGIEATKKIRSSEHPEATTIPIIAMTANAFAEDVAHCKEAGMNDHLSKPIEINKVIATIQKYTK